MPVNQQDRDSGKRLKAIIDTAIDGIITIDAHGSIESINPAAAKLFQYEPDEVIGKNVSVLMPEPDKSQHDTYLRNYFSSNEPKIIGIGREVEGQKKDGTIFPIRLAVSEVVLDNGIFFTGIVHDLTSVKRAHQEIRKLNEDLEHKVEERTEELAKVINRLLSVNKKLEQEIRERTLIEAELEASKEELNKALRNERELGELKSRFVSMASHEFRTPLSTILSSASLLKHYTESDQQPQRDKHISRIRTTVGTLNGIISDFLSLSKLEEGQVSRNIDEVNITELCKDLTDEIAGLMKEDQRIKHRHPEKDILIRSDRMIIKNILYNLIGNAVKYSDPGSIVTVRSEQVNGWVRIAVTDQGMGIPESDQEHLFTRFFRASNAINIQGTGLGLTIVKTYLDMLGGEISFQSEEGKGSTFEISLPVKAHIP